MINMAGLAVVGAATAIFAATPGPAVLSCLISGTVIGPNRTVPFIMGIVAGDILYLIVSLVGIASVVNEYSEVLYICSALSGLFLLYSGIRAVLKRKKSAKGNQLDPDDKQLHFREGVILTAGNPKVLIFYFAILPNWLPVDNLTLIHGALIILIMAVILFAVNWIYALLGKLIGGSLVKSMSTHPVDIIGGGLIALVGLYVCIYSIYQLSNSY